jgi:hypothetical protein
MITIVRAINTTGGILTYINENITIPAFGTVTIPNNVVRAFSVDSSVNSDILAGNLHLNDTVNTYIGAAAQLFLNNAATALTAIIFGSIASLNGEVDAQTTGSSVVTFNITGTWVATLVIESTVGDGTWQSVTGFVIATGTQNSTFSSNESVTVGCAGFTEVRIRASAYTSGTVSVTSSTSNYTAYINQGVPSSISAGWPTKMTDGTNGPAAVKAPSTAAVAADSALVVAISPNNAISVNAIPVAGTLATYSSSITGLSPASLATDIFTIIGSATKTITITNIEVSATQTTAGTINTQLIKRSTADTGGGSSSITEVQHTSSFSQTSSVTSTVTVTSTGAGNLLVVGTSNAGARTVTGVSDGTNAFTQATGAAGTSTGTGSGYSDIWYLLSSSAGKTTITVTWSGAAGTFFKDIFFWEVNGLISPIFGSGNHINQGTQSGGTATGASVTTVLSQGFAVGVDSTNGAVSANPASGNAFTSGGNINATSDNAGCSLIVAAAGTYNPAWTDSGTVFASSTAVFTGTASTPSPLAAVPHNKNNAVATAVVYAYTTNPTLGAIVGPIRSAKVFVPTTATIESQFVQNWMFGTRPSQAIVLIGATDTLAINLNGTTVAGGLFDIDIEWTEQ